MLSFLIVLYKGCSVQDVVQCLFSNNLYFCDLIFYIQTALLRCLYTYKKKFVWRWNMSYLQCTQFFHFKGFHEINVSELIFCEKNNFKKSLHTTNFNHLHFHLFVKRQYFFIIWVSNDFDILVVNTYMYGLQFCGGLGFHS